MEEWIEQKIIKTANSQHQVSIMEFINGINLKKDNTLNFLKNLNIYTSNLIYEIANIEVWEDWKVKKIYIKKKNDSIWELVEIEVNNYEYNLDRNSSYNTDDESLVARFKGEINFKTKIKWLNVYIKEILKQFHEIKWE